MIVSYQDLYDLFEHDGSYNDLYGLVNQNLVGRCKHYAAIMKLIIKSLVNR